MDEQKKELSEKQKQFCQEYIIDFNSTQAAIRAGYSEKTARSIGSENLTKPDIQEYLQILIQERNKRVEYNQDDVMRDLLEVKNRCMQAIPVMRFDKEEKEYIQEVDENGNEVWRFDAQGALGALDKLAKHTGFYELDNSQKAINALEINVVKKEEK